MLFSKINMYFLWSYNSLITYSHITTFAMAHTNYFYNDFEYKLTALVDYTYVNKFPMLLCIEHKF